jgi:mercuric ion transport protein
VTRRPLAAAGGAVTAAFASALCCAGPLLAVAVGVSGAGLAGTFEPLRPYLLGVTFLMLGLAHYLVHREDTRVCEPGTPCADPRTVRRTRWVVWIATVVAVIFASYPRWSAWVLT